VVVAQKFPLEGAPRFGHDDVELAGLKTVAAERLAAGQTELDLGISGGVPRTHQFLVTLTVHTNKINPATTPTATSAAVMTNATPWSSSRETDNTPVHQAVIINVVEGDLPSVQGLSS
jgi:hypothetical protein